jgi:glutamate dehydrogenase/leucine dehydrogenase
VDSKPPFRALGREKVARRLRNIMNKVAQRVLKVTKERNCSMRIASYAAAIEYLDKVYNIRGVFP